MDFSIILSIAALGVSIGSGYYLWRRMNQIEVSFDHLSHEISDVVIDSKLSSAFADGSLRSLDKLAKQVFQKLKLKLNLDVDSYSEMASELNHVNMNKEFRQTLINFFNQMIQISYRGQSLSKEEISDLQKQIRVIIKSLQKA